MDITARRKKNLKVITHSFNTLYPHDLSLYKVSPQQEIVLSEFEELAFERLQLLRIIDQASLKGHKLFGEDWKTCIKEDLTKAGLKQYKRLMSGYGGQTELDHQARRIDHLSHYILRLAYCRSEDLRRWFLNRELEWFKLRFIVQNEEQIKKFLEINDLTYVPISHEQKSKVYNELIMSSAGISDVAVETMNFYKVPYQEVFSLVRNRRVYLETGFAYIPTTELVVCVQAKFRANLNEALNIANHRLPSLDDERINYLLMNLNNSYTGKDYSIQRTKDEIDPAKLDLYSKKHFPLCMRYMHDSLRSVHHLKHDSRLQYGLFLKGIGLSYDNAMQFWREEFTKTMDGDKFEKRYSYNFKHQYGKVGRMVSYSPYSCIKIIMNNVAPGAHHGCPFKHWDSSILKMKMGEYGLRSEGIEAVMELVKNGHFQIACGKYFEFSHSQAPTNVINHPNQFFEESINLSEEKSVVKNV